MNYCDMLLRQYCDRYCDKVGGVTAGWRGKKDSMRETDKPDINPTETRQSAWEDGG